MAKVAATVITADLALRADADMRRTVFRVVALRVGVPSSISELARRRVKRVITCLAYKVAILWEEAAELTFAIGLSSTLPQHAEFF